MHCWSFGVIIFNNVVVIVWFKYSKLLCLLSAYSGCSLRVWIPLCTHSVRLTNSGEKNTNYLVSFLYRKYCVFNCALSWSRSSSLACLFACSRVVHFLFLLCLVLVLIVFSCMHSYPTSTTSGSTSIGISEESSAGQQRKKEHRSCSRAKMYTMHILGWLVCRTTRTWCTPATLPSTNVVVLHKAELLVQ